MKPDSSLLADSQQDGQLFLDNLSPSGYMAPLTGKDVPIV